MNEIKFEGVWGELEAKNHLRQPLVFMWNGELPETFNFYFSAVFC